MSDDRSGLSPGDVGRSWWTAVLACCCLVALLFAAGALPALSAPLDGSDSPGSGGPVSSAVGDAVENGLDQRIVGGGVSDETRFGGLDRYNNPGDRELFRVDADEPAYWRSSSYDTYDHDGWIRSDETTDPLDIPYRSDRESLTHEVTFTEPLRIVPAAPMPIEASAPVDLSMDSGGGLQADEALRSGETVTVRSVQPVTDRDQLAEHDDWDYPDDVEEHFTDLPDDVPDRVHERTDEITADAENPHEQAVAIEQWLRENRDYSLQVSPPEGDVADELLFERESAHCAYFATTMAVMLRSNDVPARYVTGYSSGEATDDGFTVRERNAHAWVEVYYPEVGWVPFEPTPPSDRQEAIDQASPDTVEPHGYDPADANGTDDPSDPGDNGTDDPSENGLSIELESDPVPGESLTVTVTYDGDPASYHEVTFNGEVVGTTGEDGQVTGEVPYAESLEVDAEPNFDLVPFPDDEEDEAATGAGTPTSAVAAQEDGGSVSVPLATDVDVAFEGPPVADESVTVAATLDGAPVAHAGVYVDDVLVGSTDEDGRATVDVPAADAVTVRVERGEAAGERSFDPSAIDLSVDGEPLAGEAATLEATVDGVPVPDADVLVDGGVVGTTDADGSTTVDVPPQGDATVRVERSGAAGETTIEPTRIALDVEDDPLVLPFRSTTVVAESNGSPVADVPVVVDGERVATTDENGTASVSAPPSVASSIALGSDGQLAETTVWPLPVLAGVLAALGAGIVVAVLLARRIGRDGLEGLADLGSRAAGRVMAVLVAASEGVDRLVEEVDGSVRRLLAVLASGLAEVPGRLPTMLRRVAAALRDAGHAALTAPLAILRGARGQSRAGATGGEQVGDAAAGPGDAADAATDPAGVVRRTWYALVAALPVARPETRTPAELADAATDAGFPERAVRRLLDAFRSVEYAGREPTPEDVEHARTAFEDGPGEGED